MKKILKIAMPGVLLVGVAAYVSYKKLNSEKISYREATVTRENISVSVTTTGTVYPENRLEIKPPIAGRVDRILFNEGEKVAKGQIVAWMSSTERAALLDAARAQGEAEVKRWEELYRSTPIIAPISGTIILRNVEAGQTLTSDTPVLVISDRLTVRAQVDETDMASVKLGQSAEVVLDAYSGTPIAAKVKHIAFEAKTVSNVTTYEVDVTPLSSPVFMRSGMTANISFNIQSRENVLSVPNEFITLKSGKPLALIKKGEKMYVEAPLTLGLTDGKNTEILGGLAEGDKVFLEQKSSGRKKTTGTNPLNPTRRPATQKR